MTTPENSAAADPLSETAAIDRMTDASMLAHRVVRLVADATECLGLACGVFFKHSEYAAACRAAEAKTTAEEQAA